MSEVIQFPQPKKPEPKPAVRQPENELNCTRCGGDRFRLWFSGAVFCATPDCGAMMSNVRAEAFAPK